MTAWPAPLAYALNAVGLETSWEYPGILVIHIGERTEVWLDDDHVGGDLLVGDPDEPELMDECPCGDPSHDHHPRVAVIDPTNDNEVAHAWADLLKAEVRTWT